MTDWETVNKRMKECQKNNKPEKVIECLVELFGQSNEGLVAFNIGQEYEKINKLEEAMDFYEKAEYLLPLPDFRERSREAINKIRTRLIEKGVYHLEGTAISLPEILKFEPVETLLIVSGTRDKVWNVDPTAPDFVPARYVYRGKKFHDFLAWAEDNKIENKGFFWMILSGKYGFTEPWAPIARYDVNLSDQRDFPISTETLKNQARQKRWWRNERGVLTEKRMTDVKSLILINCSSSYKDRITEALPDAHYHEAVS
ncbi:MAG: tetratricopeptide repeat protein [Acidobacteriota bacterium]|nr:tetratricopeptide repeat protein [Acidobacteriota bacterium]